MRPQRSNGEAILWFREFHPAEDTDADGLADDWELRYFGTTTATTGAADWDGDGMSNAAEQTAGTDPASAGSVFKLLSASVTPAPAQLVLRWPSVCGRVYELRADTNVRWAFTQVVQANIAATPPLNVSTVAVAVAVREGFYRLAVRVP